MCIRDADQINTCSCLHSGIGAAAVLAAAPRETCIHPCLSAAPPPGSCSDSGRRLGRSPPRCWRRAITLYWWTLTATWMTSQRTGPIRNSTLRLRSCPRPPTGTFSPGGGLHYFCVQPTPSQAGTSFFQRCGGHRLTCWYIPVFHPPSPEFACGPAPPPPDQTNLKSLLTLQLLSCGFSHAQRQIHAHVHKHTEGRTHTEIHAQKCANTQTYTNNYTCTHICKHTNVHLRIDLRTHRYTFKYTCAHTQTYTRT